MFTLSIQIQNGFKAKIWSSSSIWNVLLKTESMSTLSIQAGLSRKSPIPDERNPSEYVETGSCYSKQREILKKGHPEWRFVDTVNTGSSGIEDFLLKPQTPVSTVSTNIAFNALYALIFVSTVSTNKIPYSIHNSIVLIFCVDFLDMPFNVHTTDKVTMGVNEWLPHYLIWSRSHCNSKG